MSHRERITGTNAWVRRDGPKVGFGHYSPWGLRAWLIWLGIIRKD